MPLDTTWLDALPSVTLPGQAPPAAAQQGYSEVIDVGGPRHTADIPAGDQGSQLAPSTVGGKGGAPTDMAWMDALPSVTLPKDQPQPPRSTLTGMVANAGAGTSDAVAGALGGPVDLATGAINLGLKGIYGGARALNGIVGGHKPPDETPQITNPVGGSDSLKSLFGMIGADPRNVVPQGVPEQVARSAGSGAASMVLPWAGARALPALAGIPGALQTAMGSGSAAGQAAMGAGAGVGGLAAESAAPEPMKPLANMAGQIAGGGLVAAPTALAKGVGRAAGHQISSFTAPLTEVGRQRLAGQRIAGAASDLGAVHEALDNLAPSLVPGSEPTTFQATGDQGLGNLERVAAKNAPDQFIARNNAQNAARVAAVESPQTSGDPHAVGEAFRGQLQALDRANEAVAGGAQRNAQSATAAIGNAPPVGADAQASTLQRFGNTIRGKLDTVNADWKKANSELYAAVDPDGKLTVDMRPFRQAVAHIVKDRPQNLGRLKGEAGEVFGLAQMQPAVQKFSEVGALRQSIGDAAATELRQNGSTQTYRYLTVLRGALDDTLSGAVAEKAAADAEAVRSGAMAPGDAIGARLSAQDAHAGSNDSAGNSRSVGGIGNGPGQPGEIRSGAGEHVPAQQERRNAGGGGAVPAQAADAVAPLKGSNRQAETLHDFVISKGGVLDQGGELASQDLDRIHHRMGGRLVNNTSGMPLDYMREAAVEEGFLPANADINDLKDALQSKAPVYRISEAADAARAKQDTLNARLNDEARYNSRDAVAAAFDEAGVRPSRGELEHATDLHVRGVHADEAARQATEATADTVLQRNAEYNNIGSPGVPPSARQSELNAEPPVAATWNQAALGRRRTADAAHSERMQTLGPNVPGVGPALRPGSRPGEFKMGASEVPANLFMGGKGAAERIQAFQRAATRDPSMMGDLEDYAAFSFRRAAEDADGTINPAKADKWRDSHAEVMGAFPNLARKFDTAISARQALDDVVARQKANREAYQTSTVSRLMGDADPVKTVGRILGSDNAVAQMQDLARKTAGDPAARAGLRRAVVEHILDKLRSNTLAGDERALKSDAFQTFVRNAAPALRTVFSSDEVQTIQNVAADLQRAQKSVSGTKLPGGSNTAQDLAAGEKHGSHGPSILTSVIAAEAGGEAMGHLTGVVGKVAGMIAIPVINAMRSAGMGKVDALVTEAMLNPALAKALLAKVPPSVSSARAMGKVIATQMQALAATAAVTSGQSKGGR